MMTDKPKQTDHSHGEAMHCPALEYGRVAGCRTCKWPKQRGGGPGSICLEMREKWVKKQNERQRHLGRQIHKA